MKDKIKYIIIGLISVSVIVMILGIILILLNTNNVYSDKIPDNYIAIFNGGSGEVTYQTYIYKIDNGQDNYGFKYINTTNTTKQWGSDEVNIKITGKGTVTWTDDVFMVAKKNNAYSFVITKDSKNTYTIEEFQGMFLMD